MKLVFLFLIFVFPVAVIAQTPTAGELPTFLTDLEKVKSTRLSIQSEQKGVEAAADKRFSTQLFWTPTLSVSAARDHSRQTFTDQSIPEVKSSTDYWKATAGLNLLKGGQDLYLLGAALSAEEAQKMRLEDEEIKTEVRAADTIFKRIYVNQEVLFIRQIIKWREEFNRTVSARFDRGQIPLQDVLKSEVDLAQQKSRLRNLEISVLENSAELKALLEEDLETARWPLSYDQKLNLNWRKQTAELGRLEKLAASLESSWKAQRSAYFPRLDVVGTYRELPLKERTTQEWVMGVQLTLPLWEQFQTQAAISASIYQASLAQSQYRDLDRREGALRKILQPKLDLARANLIDANTNLMKSEHLYKDILKSFKFGRLSMNELLIEQNRVIEAQQSLNQNQLSFHQALVQSCALMGLQLKNCLQ